MIHRQSPIQAYRYPRRSSTKLLADQRLFHFYNGLAIEKNYPKNMKLKLLLRKLLDSLHGMQGKER